MENNHTRPVITLKKDGPLVITGSYTITDEKSVQVDSGTETYLCRCGNSNNKPFCDGSHNGVSEQTDSEDGVCN